MLKREEEPLVYEVWDFLGTFSPKLVSSDPVEIVHWLRSHPVGERYYNVHPLNLNFHRGSMIAHDFVNAHKKEVAEDIVRKAFEAGEPEGLAEELYNLYHGM